MKSALTAAFAIGLLGAVTALADDVVADAAIRCTRCGEWNEPFEPFQIWANTWYVGTKGLSAILVTSDNGHVLIDGALAQSAPVIAANIEKAGFRLADVKLILNSHAHFDHAGGIAALQRASGASVAASQKAQVALARGGPTTDDPQFGFGAARNDFTPVHRITAVRDGGNVKIGGRLTLTAHYTPGHTPGGTTWTWRSCDGDECRDIVYADSLNPVASPDYRFSDHPDVVEALLRSSYLVADLPCDILLAPHPELFDRDAKIAARAGERPADRFTRRGECKSYAQAARRQLEKRLTQERASKH